LLLRFIGVAAVADKFFNGLFNNINLTFSEFGVVMKEVPYSLA